MRLSGLARATIVGVLTGGVVGGCATSAAAQAPAGGAVAGVAIRSSGVPVVGARVRLVNAATGVAREVTASSGGRFLFEDVPPGGPYHVEGLAIGLAPARRGSEFTVALGERVTVDVTFADPRAAAIAPLIVRARARDENGGPSFSIPASAVHGLPLLNRDFTGLFATTPQATGRTSPSIGGQNPRLNAIQIDGGIANDVYGVAATPGAAAGAKSISLEALNEVRVLVAPFDVRQSMFSGALINAVTRSGTNRWETSVFASFQHPRLVGTDTSGARANEFEFLQYGFTVAGPIVRDHVHFFLAADLQRSRAPFVGPVAGDTMTGISIETAHRAANAFRNQLGFDAGRPDIPVLRQPDRTLFAKVDWALSPRHSLELWQNRSDARTDALGRPIRSSRDGWELSGSGSTLATAVNSTRLRLASTLGSLTNELVVGAQSIADDRNSRLERPRFLVQGDVAGTYLSGGSDRQAQGTTLDQRTVEITDNVTRSIGSHEITGGVHAEWFGVTDRFFPNSWGVWTFPSVTALESLTPTRYEISLPLRAGGPVGGFHASLSSAYVQDRWSPSERLTVTAGVRLDVPHNTAPSTNPTLVADPALGNVDTGIFPSGNAMLSPRASIGWNLDRRGRMRLRLGAGDFMARPPYVWLGNAFITTGLDAVTLVCTVADGVPAPTTDISRLPDRCTNSERRAPPPAAVTYFDRGFRFPQVRKVVVGIDRELGSILRGSLDLIETRSRSAAYLDDTNLRPVETDAEGRAMYGTISSTGVGRPTRSDSAAFSQVLRYSNRAGDRSTALSATLAARWSKGSVQAGYQWSRTQDVITLLNPAAAIALQNAPIDGTLENRRLTRSELDVPRNFVLNAVVELPRRVTGALLFRAQPGRPFSYVALGDANADGVQSNDLMYVPRNASDVSLTNPDLYPALDAFIESDRCLRSQRGRIVSRNSCRNPSILTLDSRLSKAFNVRGTSRFEIALDVFDLPNLLNRSWGLVRETTSRQELEVLQVAGWDPVANRPRYAVPATLDGPPVLPARNRVLLDESRWRIQLGAHYSR
jgi:hypothetical protein